MNKLKRISTKIKELFCLSETIMILKKTELDFFDFGTNHLYFVILSQNSIE